MNTNRATTFSKSVYKNNRFIGNSAQWAIENLITSVLCSMYFRFMILTRSVKAMEIQLFLLTRKTHSMMRWNLTSKKFPTETEYGHIMMSWNLNSKKSSTPTEYGVWKLLSCIFTYQSQKNPFP